MQDLIVLGLVPGTNIQIGFFGLLAIVAAVICIHLLTRRCRQASALRYLVVRLCMALVNHRVKKV